MLSNQDPRFMGFIAKMYSLVENVLRQPTRRTNLEQDKFLPYFDSNNNFPLVWHEAISKSPSATSCLSTVQSFMVGSGFTDQELEKKVANTQGENWFQIHQKASKDFSEFEGCALRVMYNAMGQITEVYHMPFENVRLGKPDDKGFIGKILYNPYFGTNDYQQTKDETKEYDTFNPKKEVVQEQMRLNGVKYRGQILFLGTTNALSRFYPMPEAFSAVKWMKIEAGVSDYHESNINNGFLQPYMLIMKGNPDEPVPVPEGETPMTRGEAFDMVISSDFMGAKRVGNLVVYWQQNSQGSTESPEVLTLPTNATSDAFLTVDTQATKKITIAWKVPAILANINEGVSLGGDGNTIRVAVKLMQTRLVDKQRMLTDTYESILRAWDRPYTEEVNIKPYHPYPELEILDDKIWNAMTQEERRDWITKNTNIDLSVAEAVPAPLPPTPGAIMNAIPVSFPEDVIKTVKATLDYKQKMEINCGSRGGLALAELILNNKNLALKDLRRINNYLIRNVKNENSPLNEGCHVIEYNLWGGKAMRLYLENKLEEINTWLNKTN